MYEHYQEPLLTKTQFLSRLLDSIFVAIAIIAISLFIGMIGYHSFEKMSWVDSFVNSAMILSGMGPFNDLHTSGGKIFAGIYALFSGLAFVAMISIIFAPIVHRFFHKFHLDIDSEEEETK